MKYAKVAAITCVIAIIVFGSHSSFADGEFVPGDLIVTFDGYALPAVTIGETIQTQFEPLAAAFQVYHIESARALFVAGDPLQNIYVFHFPVQVDLDSLRSVLRQIPHVRAVDKNWISHSNATANDYYFNTDWNGFGGLDQWTLYSMQVDRAWDITKGSASVVVAVIDNGFDYQHPDLDSNVVWVNSGEDINHNGVFDNFPASAGGDIDSTDNDNNGTVDDVIGYDFKGDYLHPFGDPDPQQDPADTFCHGTMMGSIIRAETDNHLGIAGATWNCKIMPLRIGVDSNLTDDKLVLALNYAIRNHADVINMSFSHPGEDADDVRIAIEEADSRGILLVGSAGGSHNETPYYPGAYPQVIRVASVTSSGYRTINSSYGTSVDVCGPTSQDSDNEAGIIVCQYLPQGVSPPAHPGDSGPHVFRPTDMATSGAAAEVSAVCALLKSFYPNAPSSFIKSELSRGAKALPDALFGQGKLGAGVADAYRSLTQWGTISTNTTWGSIAQPTTIYVSGDITVAAGTTLTILPGTTVHIARDDNEHLGTDNQRIEFNVLGTLVADGSAAQPIVFDLWNGQANQSWVGFYFDAQSSGGLFDYCTISGAETGIESFAALSLTNSTITNCASTGVLSFSGGALIQDCVFSNAGHIGIDLRTELATVRNTIVDGAVDYAVSAFGFTTTQLQVRNSEFTNSGTGLFVDGGAQVDIDSTCYFYHNGAGIHLYNTGSRVHVKDCGFALNTTNGIVCDGTSSPLIEYNVFAHNSGAIYSSNYATPKIQWNQVQSNGTAITATSHAAPDLGHNSASGSQSTGNNQIAHAPKYVVNNTTDQVYAENNCWDVNTGTCQPSSSRFTGSVDHNYPQCCSFPLFTHGEGEPVPEDGFVFQGPPPLSPKAETRRTTALVGIVPNPFNPITTIHYSLGSQGRVEIRVYDVAGRLIRTLVNETETAGEHSVDWRGADGRGAPVASGIYFVRMAAQNQVFTQKMVLLK